MQSLVISKDMIFGITFCSYIALEENIKEIRKILLQKVSSMLESRHVLGQAITTMRYLKINILNYLIAIQSMRVRE